MKSFKMKTLSLAVLGFVGFGLAGSAFAACPAGASIANGGAWSSQTTDSGTVGTTLAVTSPGLNNTGCKLSLTVNAGALTNTAAYVSDTSPQSEQRYRARFYFDISALTGLTLSNQQAKIFDAFANTAPGSSPTDEIIVRLVGGAPTAGRPGPGLRILVADTSVAGVSYHTLNVPIPAAGATPGHYYFEFDLQLGAPGTFRYWITPEGVASSDSSPTGTYAATNSGWSGVVQANLGSYTMSIPYLSAATGHALSLDEFDSRRQTFIGQ